MKCIYWKKPHLWFKGTAKQLQRKLRYSTVARGCSEIPNSSEPYLLPVADLTFVCIGSLNWQIAQYFPLIFLLACVISREITDFSGAGDNARKQTASAVYQINDKLWLVPSCLSHWWRVGWPDRTKLEKNSGLPSSSQAVVSKQESGNPQVLFPSYFPEENSFSKKNQIRKRFRGEELWIGVLGFCSPLGFDEMETKEGLTQEFGK